MKRIISLLALAGFVVACQPEEIETAFTIDNAVATITVTATDVATGADAFENGADLTAGAGTVSRNVVTITGTPAISAQTVELVVTYNGVSYPESVYVNSVLAGGQADYSVSIVVGEIPGEYTYELVTDSSEGEVQTEYATGFTHNHAYNDEGWRENATEFIVNVTVDYTITSGSEVVGYELLDASFESVAQSYYAALDSGVSSVDDVLEFQVSAWSIFRAWQTRTVVTTEYTLWATLDGSETEVAKYTVKTYYSTSAEYEEMAHPSHAGHYVYGHGHSGGENSGGGIVFAE